MTQKIHALLYGFDLPPVGVSVSVYFVGQRLFIDNMPIELHSSQLTVSVGGFDHNELFLIYLLQKMKDFLSFTRGKTL